MTRVGAVAGILAVVAGIGSAVGWGDGSATSHPSDDRAVSGALLFAAKGCAQCHTGPHSTAPFGVGPPLDDAPSWAGDRRPGLGAGDYLAESILAPAAFISPAFTDASGPVTGMPQLRISASEVEVLVEYLLHRADSAQP